MTRFLVPLVVCGLACLFVGAKPDKVAPAPAGKIPKDTCIKPTFHCASECLTCMKHCRDHKMVEMAKECEVCLHACLMCHHAVEGKTAHAWEICELCEKVCADCAAMCEKSADEQVKKCATACRECVKACEESRK